MGKLFAIAILLGIAAYVAIRRTQGKNFAISSNLNRSALLIIGASILLTLGGLWGWFLVSPVTFDAWLASGIWVVALLLGVGSIALIATGHKTAKRYFWVPLIPAILFSLYGIASQQKEDSEIGDSHSRVIMARTIEVPKDLDGKGFVEVTIEGPATVGDLRDFGQRILSVVSGIDSALGDSLRKSPLISATTRLEDYQSFETIVWKYMGSYLGFQMIPSQKKLQLGDLDLKTHRGQTEYLGLPVNQSRKRVMLMSSSMQVVDGEMGVSYVTRGDYAPPAYIRQYSTTDHHLRAFRQSLRLFAKAMATNSRRRVVGKDAVTLLMPGPRDDNMGVHLDDIDFSKGYFKIRVTGNCIKPGTPPTVLMIMSELPFTGQLSNEEVKEFYFDRLPNKPENELDPELFETDW